MGEVLQKVFFSVSSSGTLTYIELNSPKPSVAVFTFKTVRVISGEEKIEFQLNLDLSVQDLVRIMESHDLDKKDVRRPMNAFLIFCKRHRTMVREKNPNLDNRSVTRILGDLWANLQEEEKAQYTDLAKQYKDAFMRANPDYKWHNPDKLGVAVPVLKPSTRPSNLRPGGREDDIYAEGSIVSGKLADPSNMGGLSLLLMAGQQTGNKQSGNQTRVTSPTSPSGSGSLLELAEMCSTKLQHNGKTTSQTPDMDDQVLDLTNKKYHTGQKDMDKPRIKSPSREPICELNKEKKCHPVQTQMEVGLDLSHLKKPIKLETRAPGDKHVDDVDFQPENLSKFVETSFQKSVVKSEPLDSEMDKIPANMNFDSDEEQGDDEDAILTCRKVMMDHIIEKLYSSQHGRKESSQHGRKDKQKQSGKDEEQDVKSLQFVGSESHLSAGTDNLRDKISGTKKDMELDSVVCDKRVEHSKPPCLPLKLSIKEEFLKGDKFAGRKRCYSEPCGDNYENHLPPKKLQRMFEGFTSSVDSSQSQGSKSGDSENADDTAGDDEFQPVRKSKRRNRGQRYQELINEGIIQPSKERLAAIKGEATLTNKQEESNSDEEPCKELRFDVLSVYPRQIRKRTCSESEKTRSHLDENKRYKTGDFDLEAHIATLPACSLEKVTRTNKRAVSKPRSVSESGTGKRPSVEEAPVEVVLTVPPHLKCAEKPGNNEPVVGSRKRKARKHSITHLQLLPPNPTGVNKVIEKIDERNENMDFRNIESPSDTPGGSVKAPEQRMIDCTQVSHPDEGANIINKSSNLLTNLVKEETNRDANSDLKLPPSDDLELPPSDDLELPPSDDLVLQTSKDTLCEDVSVGNSKSVTDSIGNCVKTSTTEEKLTNGNDCALNELERSKTSEDESPNISLSKGDNSVVPSTEDNSIEGSVGSVSRVENLEIGNEINSKLKQSDNHKDSDQEMDEENYDDGSSAYRHCTGDANMEVDRTEMKNFDNQTKCLLKAEDGDTSTSTSNLDSCCIFENCSQSDEYVKTKIAEISQQTEDLVTDITPQDKICCSKETGCQVRKSTLEKLRRSLNRENSLVKEKSDSVKLSENFTDKETCNDAFSGVKEFVKESDDVKSSESSLDAETLKAKCVESNQGHDDVNESFSKSCDGQVKATTTECIHDNDTPVDNYYNNNNSSKILKSILSKSCDEGQDSLKTKDVVASGSEFSLQMVTDTSKSAPTTARQNCVKDDCLLPTTTETTESNSDINSSIDDLLSKSGNACVSPSALHVAAVKS